MTHITAEYNRMLVETRPSKSEVYAKKLEHVHLTRNLYTQYLSEELAEYIGKNDVDHERKLIPNIDIKADPFRRFEGNWDLEDIKEYSDYSKIKLWKPDTKVFKPHRAFMFKHQNPKIGFLDKYTYPVKKRVAIYPIGSAANTQTIYSRLTEGNHDLSKIWRIEGMLIPMGYRSVDGYWADSHIDNFPVDFTFGIKLSRTVYAMYDFSQDKFIHPSRDIRYTKYPVLVSSKVYKWNRQFVKLGYNVEDYYKNVAVVRYHFHPLVSFQLDLKYNNLCNNDARTLYNKGVDNMHKKNYYAFRYHIKQLDKLRKKI